VEQQDVPVQHPVEQPKVVDEAPGTSQRLGGHRGYLGPASATFGRSRSTDWTTDEGHAKSCFPVLSPCHAPMAETGDERMKGLVQQGQQRGPPSVVEHEEAQKHHEAQ